MSLAFDCSLCGQRIKAQDSLAGKKARCPQCQGIVDVPEQTFQAEAIAAAAPPPEQPAFSSFDAPQAASEPVDTGARKPCPQCGEMIVASALKCRYCGALFDDSIVGDGSDAKSGRIVLRRGEAESGQLPDVCMQCGAPAAGHRSKTFTYNPPWVYFLLLAGLLPCLIVAMLVSKRVKLRATFCEQHLNHWKWRNTAVLLGFLGLVVGGGGLFFLAISLDPGSNMGGLVCVGSLVALVALLIFAAVLSEKSIHPKEITDSNVTLTNVSAEFIEALHAYRRSHGFVPAAATSSGGGGSMIVLAVFLVCFLVIVGLAAISVIGEKRQKQFNAVGVEQPIIDAGNNFELVQPGPGWTMMPGNQLRAENPLAMAGAVNGDIVGLILVEPEPPGMVIRGNEQPLGQALVETSPLQDKRMERIEPITVQGLRGVRVQFTGRQGPRRVRAQSIVINHGGLVYQIFALGPESSARPQSFQPFVNAFRLLNR